MLIFLRQVRFGVMEASGAGRSRSVEGRVDRTFPLQRVWAALLHVEKGSPREKVVVKIG